jgi:hypothetical protein
MPPIRIRLCVCQAFHFVNGFAGPPTSLIIMRVYAIRLPA